MKTTSGMLYVFCFITILFSCQSQKETSKSVMPKLDSVELRNSYLEEIYNSDQTIRATFASSDFDSEEKHNFWKVAAKTDSINLLKIDSYLNQFGYPDSTHYSDNARKAPWYVIQHCPKLDVRIKYYPLLKMAYQSRKIRDIDFYLYLQRNFVFKHKEMLGIENDDNYSFEEKIEIFQDTLGYEK